MLTHVELGAGYYLQLYGFSLFAVGYGAFVLWAYTNNNTGSALDRLFRAKPLVLFGQLSYGIYVCHAFVNQAAFMTFHNPAPGLLAD